MRILSADGLAFIFNCVEGAKFKNGLPGTSTNVTFSIRAIKANHLFRALFNWAFNALAVAG
jgi:peptide/nickel transport system substrate-binding protein